MELRLTVEGSPPSGLLHHGAQPPLPFAGWLELLRVLSLTVGDGAADPAVTARDGVRARAETLITEPASDSARQSRPDTDGPS